jgi:hypothetical protein
VGHLTQCAAWKTTSNFRTIVASVGGKKEISDCNPGYSTVRDCSATGLCSALESCMPPRPRVPFYTRQQQSTTKVTATASSSENPTSRCASRNEIGMSRAVRWRNFASGRVIELAVRMRVKLHGVHTCAEQSPSSSGCKIHLCTRLSFCIRTPANACSCTASSTRWPAKRRRIFKFCVVTNLHSCF